MEELVDQSLRSVHGLVQVGGIDPGPWSRDSTLFDVPAREMDGSMFNCVVGTGMDIPTEIRDCHCCRGL